MSAITQNQPRKVECKPATLREALRSGQATAARERDERTQRELAAFDINFDGQRREILDRFLHHAETVAITGRSYRLKNHAAIAGKEDKNKKAKSKPNELSTAEPAS